MNTVYELAKLARDGNREALADLVEMLRPRLFGEAYFCLGHYDDAQDAVASALLRICLSVDKLREPENVGAWVRRIVHNEALKLRKRDADVVLPDDDLLASDDSGELGITRLDIENALRRLPIDNARALTLFYFAGISVDEIARRVGRPAGTIKRWLHNGRRQLAVELEDYAPMHTPTDSLNAAIISTSIEPNTLEQMARALSDAGYSEVKMLSHLPDIMRNDLDNDYHLPHELMDTRFVIVDETVGGRSAFELQMLLKASAESANLRIGILLGESSHLDSSILAAWSAGFDLCLVRDRLKMSELQNLSGQILSQVKAELQ